MDKAATKRTAITYLRMGNVWEGRVQQRRAGSRQWVALQLPEARHGANAHPAIVARADVVEFCERVQVNQHGGLQHAEVHRRNQALPTGKQFGIRAMLCHCC